MHLAIESYPGTTTARADPAGNRQNTHIVPGTSAEILHTWREGESELYSTVSTAGRILFFPSTIRNQSSRGRPRPAPSLPMAFCCTWEGRLMTFSAADWPGDMTSHRKLSTAPSLRTKHYRFALQIGAC